jgi:uncharacterized protein (TIGR04255 family)
METVNQAEMTRDSHAPLEESKSTPLVRGPEACASNLKGLADFQKPPAVETLVGFHFFPLQNWKTPNFGLFWQEIKKEYPDAQVHPALAEQALRVELNSALASIKLTGDVPVRWWYVHKSGKRLIQVQADSFIQNWRKRDTDDPYLHYKELRPAFQKTWSQFLRFLKRQRVESPRVRQCEVTYVNHIDRGEGWRSFADLADVFSVWRGRTYCGFLPTPDLVSMNAFYPIEGQTGRLQIMVQPGIRQPDAKQTLQLTITALCKPASSQPSDLFKSLDLGRKWVVRGFEDFTTEKMHTIWGKKPRRRPE